MKTRSSTRNTYKLTKQIRPCKNHKIIWRQKFISLKKKWQLFGKTRRNPTPPGPSSQPESSCSENTSDSEQKNTDCEASRLPITAQKLTVNIPTENRFSLLQNCEPCDSLSNTQEHIDPETNTENMTPPPPQDIAPPPIQSSVNNKAVFLCDSNGKFID